MKTEELLFYLLREELGEIKPSQEDVKEVRKGLFTEEKNSLFTLSKNHDIAHVVGNALANLELISRADPCLSFFEKEALLAIYRCENQQHEYNKIKQVFIEEKIKFIPLKGLVIKDYYPKNIVRTSCDIDILVSEEDLDRARKILTSRLGYKEGKAINYRDYVFVSESKVKIELHFSLREGMDGVDAVLEKVWDYASKVGQTTEYRMTNEFIIFYLIAHTSYHFIGGGCGIKPILDLYVLEKSLELDDLSLKQMLEKGKLERFYEVAKKLKSVWFMGKESDENIDKVAGFILRGGAYGSRENATIISNAKTGSRVKYFFSRLFLPYKKLKLVYPILQKHKWLFPIFQVVRWFSCLFGSRSENRANEMSVLFSAKKKEIEAAKTLLKEVGLYQENTQN